MNKELIAQVSVQTHFLGMILFGVVPFFIPLEILPTRPLWHFLFLLFVSVIGMILAIVYRKIYNVKRVHICFLNLITQRVRGYAWDDPRNYTYSHLKEIFQRFKINLPPIVFFITLIILTILSIINFVIYLS